MNNHRALHHKQDYDAQHTLSNLKVHESESAVIVPRIDHTQ